MVEEIRSDEALVQAYLSGETAAFDPVRKFPNSSRRPMIIFRTFITGLSNGVEHLVNRYQERLIRYAYLIFFRKTIRPVLDLT